MFEELLPLGTMTGRQQFYIDHDWYLKEFGEELPTYKGTMTSILSRSLEHSSRPLVDPFDLA